MLKLYQCGVDGKTARWIKAFLSKRTQSVVVNGQSSAPQPVTSGVPQAGQQKVREHGSGALRK